MPKIYFVDVTNRDGVQTSRLGLAKLQKTLINLMLNDMGITQSEFGFPTTMHELNYLNANLELAKRGVINRTKLSGWMRAIASDVELSFKKSAERREELMGWMEYSAPHLTEKNAAHKEPALGQGTVVHFYKQVFSELYYFGVRRFGKCITEECKNCRRFLFVWWTFA